MLRFLEICRNIFSWRINAIGFGHVMPVYNGEKVSRRGDREHLGYRPSRTFELLIVDDGSQDRSAEIIRAYEERDDRIRFFQLERNVGIGDLPGITAS